MNKSILYIALALIGGLGIGYLIFGGSAEQTEKTAVHYHTEETAVELWTCSMHPQIMREEPGDCPICGMELIPAESTTAGLSANQFKLTDNALALANIQTTVVGEGNDATSGTVKLSGTIEIDQNETATQPAHFNGRIESLTVKSLGQKVTKGQKVATVYAPELVAAQQELITASKMKETQPRLYSAVRNKLKNWMIHGSILDEIEKTGKVITNFPIYAHVSGVVTEITVNEGGHVMNGMPIFKVSNLSSVWAEFDAYESQLGLFKEGQKLTIKTNAYPNETFTGTISFIDPILNSGTRTVTVRATLNNKENRFKPGMFVSAEVEGAGVSKQNDLMIPASAVMWTGERSLVYVKPNPAEPVFEMREVTLGQKSGENYTITGGLSTGEEIVTNGTFTVDAAAQLQGKKSMMNSGQLVSADPAMAMNMNLPQEFQDAFKKSIPAYLELKDAFVASDEVLVSASAKAFQDKLDTIKITDLAKMEKSHYSKVKQMVAAIKENENLENQREHFVILNENFAALVNAISDLKPELYLQRCPMANNSKGAVWLSASKDIRNPYYGDMMMNCGSVIHTLGK